MTEKTKAIITLIGVAIAYALFVNVIHFLPMFLLISNDFFAPTSPLFEFCASTSNFMMALSMAIFVFALLKVINTGKKCTNDKFNYDFDKFFYVALALGVLKTSDIFIFSHLSYWETRNIADLIISEMISIVVFSIISELFYRHWTITFLEKHNFQPKTTCIISVIMYYAINNLHLQLPSKLFWGSVLLETLYFIASGIILYQLYSKTRDVRYCIIMQIITASTGAVITAFKSFMLPHVY